MKIPIVPFDVAQDLKELGFDWPCRYLQVGNNSPLFEFQDAVAHNTNETPQDGIVSAPEQALVIKWLLETHNLFVQVTPHFKQWYWDILETNNDPDSLAVYRILKSGKFVKVHNYPTHDDAQLEGIKECIKYLKNEM